MSVKTNNFTNPLFKLTSLAAIAWIILFITGSLLLASGIGGAVSLIAYLLLALPCVLAISFLALKSKSD